MLHKKNAQTFTPILWATCISQKSGIHPFVSMCNKHDDESMNVLMIDDGEDYATNETAIESKNSTSSII